VSAHRRRTSWDEAARAAKEEEPVGVLRFIPVAVPLTEGENVPADDPDGASLDDRLMVRGFVGSLPVEMRSLLYAIFWLDMTQTEAAAALGMHPRTVSRVLERALSRGREVMTETAFQLAA
jgi:DNA-directed RNA polymerase specialized sigma24 family protein